jgi:hypothetical protein
VSELSRSDAKDPLQQQLYPSVQHSVLPPKSYLAAYVASAAILASWLQHAEPTAQAGHYRILVRFGVLFLLSLF